MYHRQHALALVSRESSRHALQLHSHAVRAQRATENLAGVEMAQEDLGEALALAEQRATKARTAQLLVLNGGLFFVGWMVGQTAEQEIWLTHYNGGACAVHDHATRCVCAARHRDTRHACGRSQLAMGVG